MAIATTLEQSLKEEISKAKLLVVGAGGIGCELLKNLILTGFADIDVIDLDTIDVSNLNRQFLFQKRHVGKSKAVVARESVLRLNPSAKMTAYHESIFEKHFDCDFYKRFTLVLNALDNRAARNHVNRMCLNADVPLVESGSAGYLGQVTVIKRGLTECYECQPKPTQKTYPGCTIRNTPSEPIHCIVWAKHLFNQLFGEEDPDQDVSPDTADPEATADAGQHALRTEVDENDDNTVGGIKRVSTREWARNCDWNPKKLFDKFFHDDIKYLLSMDRLWQTRRPPMPLDWDDLPDAVPGSSTSSTHGLISDQVMWSMQQCGEVFQSSVNILKENLKEKSSQDDQHSYLIWDKDDDPSLDFVTAAANFRCHIFGIQQKTRFDIKSMAGNIIPAIATTNAVIAGLIVMEALKILQKKFDKCRMTYLNKIPIARKTLLNPCLLDKPNPKCPVCSEKHEVTVQLNCKSTTVKCFEEKVLKGALSMTAPDVEIEDGKGTVLISSDPSDCTDENNEKHLDFFGIGHNTRLRCDDFFQNFEIIVNIYHSEELTREVDFEIIGDVAELKAKLEKEPNENEALSNQVDGKVENEEVENAERTNGERNGTAASKSNGPHPPKDVDMVSLLSDEEDDTSKGDKLVRKRKASDGDNHAAAVIKKARVDHAAPPTDDEDLIVL